MDDQNTPSEPVEKTEATQPAPEPAPPIADPVPLGPNDSEPANTPPTAPESPINADSPTPVEDQNGEVKQSESVVPIVLPGAPGVSQVQIDNVPASASSILINESG